MADLAHASNALTADVTTRNEGRSALWPIAASVAAQAFYITVTLFVFADLQDRTETITVALIGLVFASLRASTLSGACAQRRIALLLENEINSVRQAMAREISARAIAEADIGPALAALSKPLRFEYAGLAAIGVICLYHLAIAIFYGAAYQELLGLH